MRILGSCNGLLCVASSYSDCTSSAFHVGIYNPITREAKVLPDLPSYSKLEEGGFGYDPSTKVCKVVCPFLDTAYNCKQRIKVITLGENSWRNLDFPIRTIGTCVFLNGGFHWLVRQNVSVGMVHITTLDIFTEKVEIITINLAYDICYFTNLINFEESLALPSVLRRVNIDMCFRQCRTWDTCLRKVIKVVGFEKYFWGLKRFEFSGTELGGRSSRGSGKGRSHQFPIKYGFSLIKGKANHPMEDYHVAKFVQMKEHELGLFAIYDGHLGDSVPAYLQKHLFSNIIKEGEFWTDTKRSIQKSYERTDQDILSHNPDLGRGGSTAVTAILIDGQKLWVANVGDSRAVLSKGGHAIQLSIDHEPNTERGSIENKGGFVSNMPGDVPRVNGQLAVSRAFGDKSLKLHLRSDPDVCDADVNSETDLLILASDGLWKVMTNQDAVDIARKIKDPERAAKQLTVEAVNRDSKDDISCIVVRFRG
ncbi:hypothetical protein GIB67_019341 [Kingdonia uniflora]|uniref:protein-serine/threonine phosphatase n=1 Tax=Kingdonia uniflora TaxID=39325 RepID=A0A7J7M1J1_9MAGN|nr:hypothetical protein GIB67_019341 [Kingdonia uniflora]